MDTIQKQVDEHIRSVAEAKALIEDPDHVLTEGELWASDVPWCDEYGWAWTPEPHPEEMPANTDGYGDSVRQLMIERDRLVHEGEEGYTPDALTGKIRRLEKQIRRMTQGDPRAATY